MNAIEQILIDEIEQQSAALLAFSCDIAQNAEAGFYEQRTAERTAAFFQKMDLVPLTELARTGVCAAIHGAHKGPHLAVLAELDGIRCPAHPQATADGMSHACGHHIQLAMMLGAAAALRSPAVCSRLHGSISFFAVPAEEYVPIETRRVLRKQGILACCGKSELIRRGVFDSIDLALTAHAHMTPCTAPFLLGNMASSGFVGKTVSFRGRAAHAAAAPWEGANALNACSLAINAIGLLRETFRDNDCIRIHTTVHRPAGALNVVPDLVTLEAMVRGKSLAAIQDAAAKFDAACRHTALALGCTAEIETHQGYLPVQYQPACEAQLMAAHALGLNTACVQPSDYNNASTDVGDLSHILPVVNFTHGGTTGALHSAAFQIADERLAVLTSAKLLAFTAYYLLHNGAEHAQQLMQSFVPALTIAEYCNLIEKGV